jgi:hypothetical protein
MIKSITILFLYLISLGTLASAFYLQSWKHEFVISEPQAFLLQAEDRTSAIMWKDYLNHNIETVKVSSDVLELNLKDISPNKVAEILKRLQEVKYAVLHNVKLSGDKEKQSFRIKAILTFHQIFEI